MRTNYGCMASKIYPRERLVPKLKLLTLIQSQFVFEGLQSKFFVFLDITNSKNHAKPTFADDVLDEVSVTD